MKCRIFIGISLIFSSLYFSDTNAQTWRDSLINYGVVKMMPAKKYNWNWRESVFLKSMIDTYEHSSSEKQPAYLDYIKEAMEITFEKANAKHPNAVASAIGIAFLARITKDKRYTEKALSLYKEYLAILRAPNGGVSHRLENLELWDDTVYMISLYLLEMYKLTIDEVYIREFVTQLKAHEDKLASRKTGLWVHGWNGGNRNYDDQCCMLNWANTTNRTSCEYWGRGNGWIAMALADGLKTIPRNSENWKILRKSYLKLIKYLPSLQDSTGLWYQLPIYKNETGNFLESSSSAMFGYALTVGVELKILSKRIDPSIHNAYIGLKKCTELVGEAFLMPIQVCAGTCIGDKTYYYDRAVTKGNDFAVGAYILFITQYHKTYGISLN